MAEEMKDLALEVKNLNIRFETDDETVYAVNGISFDLEKQKTMALVGETGAGKTTTVLSLLKLVQSPPGVVNADTLKVVGNDVMKMTATELEAMRGKDIAMIFQDPMSSLNPVMTVGEQIAESVMLHEGLDEKAAMEHAKEMLALVGISGDRVNDYPHQFSGGMKQRVVIAIALACRPSILIADEPTTALDVTIQAQVLELIKKLKDEYKTSTILVTHDLGIVAETCDIVAVMYAGKIIEYGSLEEIFNHTKHPYTEGLFNSLPVMGGDRSQKLKPIKGLTPDPSKIYPGCTFAERCPYATEKCTQGFPEYKKFGATHIVACSRYDEPDFHIERKEID